MYIILYIYFFVSYSIVIVRVHIALFHADSAYTHTIRKESFHDFGSLALVMDGGKTHAKLKFNPEVALRGGGGVCLLQEVGKGWVPFTYFFSISNERGHSLKTPGSTFGTLKGLSPDFWS